MSRNHFKDGLTMAHWEAPTTYSPCVVESEEAACAQPPSDFDFGPLPDYNGNFAEWDFDSGDSLNFGAPSVSTSSMPHPIVGSTYGTFQDPAGIDTNFGGWPCNPMDYREPW